MNIHSKKRLTKRWRIALENIYVREIHDMLPHQSRSKVFTELEAEGLVEPMERVFGTGVFAVKVRGWALTQLGRLTYCQSCEYSEAA